MNTIRRQDRAITTDEALALLDRAEYGVLSTVDPDGQPYGVPLSFVHKDGCLYIHCALDGHKLDNIAANPRVSFCVVGRTRLLPDRFATEYESAIAFGTAGVIAGEERHAALVWLLEKYAPEHLEAGRRYIAQRDQATKVLKIVIDRVSGKARR